MKEIPSDRATTTVVSHTLAIAITTVLLITLLMAAGSYIEDQRQALAREQLSNVGNQLASDLARVDRVSRRGGTVIATSTVPDRIAGEHYSVSLRTGQPCVMPSNPDSCLVVTMNGLHVSQTIPLRNETELSLEAGESGVYHLRSDATGAEWEGSSREIPMRVGVGSDVRSAYEELGSGAGIPPTNLSISMDPPWPSNDRTIEFTGDADDPDASDPDDPAGMSYEWEFGDGDEDSGETVSHSYADPGKYDLTLIAEDQDGLRSQRQFNVSIAGLQYTNPWLESSGSADDVSITYTVRNTHAEKIHITDLFFRPVDGADRISASDEEFIIDNGTEYAYGSPDSGGWFSAGGRSIPDSGLVVANGFSSGGWFSGDARTPINVTVGPGDTATITFVGVSGLSSCQYVMGVGYDMGPASYQMHFDTRDADITTTGGCPV